MRMLSTNRLYFIYPGSTVVFMIILLEKAILNSSRVVTGIYSVFYHTQLIPFPQSQCQPNPRIGIALGTRLAGALFNGFENITFKG